MPITINTADKVKQGDNCPMIKDVDWTIGTKVNGKKPKWQKCNTTRNVSALWNHNVF
jgi:hypothetical protein